MGALAVLLWAQGVSADDLASSSQSVLREDAAADAEPAPLPRRWYGWQIMLVDAASITAFVVGVQTEGSTGTALWASGLGAYLVGGPFVHVANDRHEHSDDSVGLRLGLPLGGAFAGGLVGAAVINCDGDGLCRGLAYAFGGGIGIIVGAATAMTVDSAVLAYKPLRPERARTPLTVAPNLALTSQGAFTGLSGTF